MRLDPSFSLKDTGFSSFGQIINASGLFECPAGQAPAAGGLMVKPREQDTVPQEPQEPHDIGELGRSELFRLCKEKGIKTGGPRVTNDHLRELLSAAEGDGLPALKDQEHIEFMARLRRTINKLDLSEKTADVVDAAADEPAPKGAPAGGAGDEKPPKP